MVEAGSAAKGVCKEILDKIKEHQNWVADKSESLPTFFEQVAQDKVSKASQFKEELMVDAKMIEELQHEAMQKIQAQIRSDEDNPDGLIAINSQSDYAQCFVFDRSKLEALLD